MLEENPLFHAAAIQSAYRVPCGLQNPAYWELHVPYTISRLFLRYRNWSTVDRLMWTKPFSDSAQLAHYKLGCHKVSRHFRPKTFQHNQTGAEMSKQFSTSAEVSRGHFGTGTELSRPPANIFATIGHTEVRLLLSKRTTLNTLPRTSDYTRVGCQSTRHSPKSYDELTGD